jgi:hemerythrin
MSDWSPELTLNHDVLDAQHLDIFRKLSAAADLLDGPRAEIEAAVAAAADALAAHLAAEERLMDEALYPERTRHRSAHELFMADFARMREELRQQGATAVVAEWVRHRIPEWLRFHLRVNDVPLAEYLARRRSHRAPASRPASDVPRRLS